MPNTQLFFFHRQQFLVHNLSITSSVPASILTCYRYPTCNKYAGTE